jgi:hypothetical protein
MGETESVKSFKEYQVVLEEGGVLKIPESVLEAISAFIPGFEENGLDVMFEELHCGGVVVIREVPILSVRHQRVLERSARLRGE